MLTCGLPEPARAGEADVLAVKAMKTPDGLYVFTVTVRHADTGWDHYADKWEILTPEGVILAVRTLLHPHVAEQPFTRTLRGVTLPEGVDRVRVRAHDSVHGYGGAEVVVDLR
ncbi:MAG: hypothetical protein NXI16_01720 [Alphaproteobacteria bacterium]|nr:hypothetical protein [Alphaproteobacteria bacterium]